MKKLRYIPFVFSVVLFSCGQEEENKIPVNPPDWNQDHSSDMNQVFSDEEEDEIDLFVKRHADWKVSETGTGLRHFIYSKSKNSDTAKVGDIVLVDFEISLLDGSVCYSSKENGPESFVVERADIESGLHEAMQLMCTDDKAKFILPSRMAHGLIGDEEKIPPLTPVVYDIHVIQIEHQ